MASLIRHPKGPYFAQFYEASRRPRRKRLSLKTRNRRATETPRPLRSMSQTGWPRTPRGTPIDQARALASELEQPGVG
jgi:hypothetical protein